MMTRSSDIDTCREALLQLSQYFQYGSMTGGVTFDPDFCAGAAEALLEMAEVLRLAGTAARPDNVLPFRRNFVVVSHGHDHDGAA
jgi:hypothetical protein